VCAGYDNGDVKLFDLRTMGLRWETNVKNGVSLRSNGIVSGNQPATATTSFEVPHSAPTRCCTLLSECVRICVCVCMCVCCVCVHVCVHPCFTQVRKCEMALSYTHSCYFHSVVSSPFTAACSDMPFTFIVPVALSRPCTNLLLASGDG